MNTTLEKTRSAHEDIELFERAIVEACIEDPKNHRESVNQSQWVNLFTEKITDRLQQLSTIYQDQDGMRRNEIQAMGGKGQQLFSNFYNQLMAIKTYHSKYPNLPAERPEAEQILNNTDIESLVEFTGEEGYGRYLDLHELYERYINLKSAKEKNGKINGKGKKDSAKEKEAKREKLEYVRYLDFFYLFPDKYIAKDKIYLDYLSDLYKYLHDFMKKTQPLFELDKTVKQFDDDFEAQWINGTFIPISYSEEDRRKESSPLWCKYSRKRFANEATFKNYQKGKNYQKAVKWYETTYKEINKLETKINRLTNNFLTENIEATKQNIEKKQARNFIENEADMDDDSDVESSSEDEEETRMTKENYPVGWDGNPIPYWLYKLHGLGIEYKCEICGNMSYWGRRAFERHFQEWRHAHGMKCLRLENTKEFHEITKMQDAVELAKRLKELKEKDKWDDMSMEEFEDPDGNVMNKKTFLDLKAQGLV